MAKPLDHDSYIKTFPPSTQQKLEELRTTVNRTAPSAEEIISYSMLAFRYNGKVLIWYAGYERHVGFYPGSSVIAAFQKEITGYKNAKGSVQFPLDKPLPVELITKMVQFKMAEIMQKAETKKAAPKKKATI